MQRAPARSARCTAPLALLLAACGGEEGAPAATTADP